MRWYIFGLMATTVAYAPAADPLDTLVNTEEKESPDEPTDCEKASRDLKNDISGLEFFLQDKSDHKTFCPFIEWEQPKLDEYKTEPKSYLPKECNAEKI